MQILRAVIPFVWIGMLAAISFIEAPLKFRAPNVTREIGLGIGRLVFRALNRIELALATIMLLCIVATQYTSRSGLVLFGVVAGILILQTVWLLPSLSARAAAVVAGEPVSRSRLHLVFVACEIAKMLLLAALGVLMLSEFKV